MLELLAEQLERIKSCRHCKGAGKKLDSRGQVVDCICLIEATYQVRLSKSGIPPRFKNLAFKDYMYQNSSTYEKIWKYINKAQLAVEQGRGLFLWGTANTGKSMLACCILKELMLKGYSCGFVHFSGLMSDIKEANKFVGKGVTFACIDSITDVLDRLINFTETNLTHELSNGAINQLTDVLTSRIMRNQPTILTSKVAIKVLEKDKRFESLGSLLSGSFLEVECVTGDFRAGLGQAKLSQEFGFDQSDG